MKHIGWRLGAWLLCTVLLLGVGGIAPAVRAAVGVTCGDINNDTAVNAADALLALQHSVKLITLDGGPLTAADVNGDGAVNASDALLILQYSVKLIDRFPVEDMGPGLPFPREGVTRTVNPWSTSTEAYAFTKGETEVNPVHTTFQAAGGYSATDDVPSDSTMVYISLISGAEGIYKTWKEKRQNAGSKSLDIMTAGGRDNGVEYFKMYPERKDYDACKRKDGSIFYHGGGTTVPYMCPTRYYRDYKLKLIETLCKLGPGFIAVEEPESFIGAEYNEGFKEEWLDYYGTEFVDPASSAEARYMSSKLMTYLWLTMIDEIGKYMAENYPEVGLVVATHSTANYTHWGIVSAVNAFTSSQYVDGIIGQTWSDTVNSVVRYGGGRVTRLFEAAFSEYATYPDSMQAGQTVYTLTDAKADNSSFTWDDCRVMWKKTVVAELMQQNIHNFQECVWPSRGFTPAPEDYRTIQLSAFQALASVGGQPSTLYAGTPGIALGLADSISWQSGFQYRSNNATTLYGFTVPLVERGIPVSVVSLDYLDSVDDLADVKVLALCYDAVKPQKEQVNEVVAEWVKQGGTLLYLGGHNDYDTIHTEWWVKKNQTPYTNLLQHLGLNITVSPAESYLDYTVWKGPEGAGSHFNEDAFLTNTDLDYANAYTGSGFTPLLSHGDDIIGFDAAVGKGHVVSVGLPSAYYAMSEAGPDQLRDLVAYALQYTNVDYLESTLMTVRRGNLLAVESMDHSAGETLTGHFVDLFDAALPVCTSVEMAAGDSALLLDITELLASDMPRLAFTGGALKDEVVETADATTFTIGGPNNTVSATRLLGNGRTPRQITATVPGGGRTGNYMALWDNATGSLLIRTPHTVDLPVTYVVTWGDDPVPDTQPYTWNATAYSTGSRNADAGFLYRDTGTATTASRQMSGDAELVYMFDLKELGDMHAELTVYGNYRIQVSADGLNFTTVYDYADVSDTPADGTSNKTSLAVFPSDCGATGRFFVRLSCNDPQAAYGCFLTRLVVRTQQLIESTDE